MRIAVLTLTRDRLAYTQHCFEKLHQNAGCTFDHWVLDQGSQDETQEWLSVYDAAAGVAVVRAEENLGIAAGMNYLLRAIDDEADYDVIVKFDNDCELTQPNTIRDVAQLAFEGGCILSPRILGLKQPPPVTRELRIGEEIIQDVPQIGGIFMAVPAWVYDDFRYVGNEWGGGDDTELCAWFRRQGGTCGYVKRLEAWHYETTEGQEERYPAYFERKYREMGLAAV